jgi:ribosome biogenesis GTPase A
MIALAAAKPEKINNEAEDSTEADAETDAS